MPTIDRIVAATDFSAAADRAVRRAALIAKELGAELHLLHVVNPLDLYPGPDTASDSQRHHYEQLWQEAGKSRLKTQAATLRRQHDVSVEAATCLGRSHTQIADYAKSVSASLVVAGTRGENTLLDLLLGSTASRLLRVTSCPVLIARNTQLKAYSQVLAAVDFSPGSFLVPQLANEVAPEAQIEILHVYDLEQEAHMREIGLDDARLRQYRDETLAVMATKMDALLADCDTPHMHRKILTGYPPAEICARAAATFADLIVLGRHGRSGVQEWLLGSVSKDVANAAGCDVLLCA